MVNEPRDESKNQPQLANGDILAIANQLRPVLLRVYRYLRNEARDVGITSTQASLLAAMQRNPGIGLGDLAAREHMTAPTLVAHIDKLEKAGFVERLRSNPRDRRRVDLHVTEQGSQVLQQLRERRTAWLAERLGTLSPESLAAIVDAIEPLQQLTRSDT